MTDKPLTWKDVRMIADELQLEAHLFGMEARDRWHQLQPRLAALEKTIAQSADRAARALSDELSELGAALRRLRDDVHPGPS